ncbi:hypothetical protein LENED_002283 [Lentinula edodes]|uniref:Uncharacterized protein n=1 Tax=Lentinula edodes TaxID=5353 RepID=A0A1Q3E0N4_LENED|nr:hypothetical protein LENED_002283 [Lentinula edodes]
MYGSPDRGKNAVQSANTRLNFLRHSARRDIVIIFDEERFKTPFLQSYLLLLSIVQMRKIMKVPSTPTLFRYMHTTISRSVDTLQRIIMLSKPPELYLNLAASSHMQADLIYISSELVNEVDDLQENLTALQEFTPDHDKADTYMARIRLNMYSVDDFVRKYEVVAVLASRLTGPEVKVYELPGVLSAMKRIRATISPFERDIQNTLEIFEEFTDGWTMQEPSDEPPILDKFLMELSVAIIRSYSALRIGRGQTFTTTIMQPILLLNVFLFAFSFLEASAAPENKDTLERREMIIRACPAACAVNCPDCCVNINCPDLCC